jgi:SAM-dependent methyltransferase
MLAEIVHFVRHAPSWLAMRARLPQHELYARLIARADAAGLDAWRAKLVAGLRGTVVEIGCGTGAMMRHFAGCDVIGVEPDAAFAARAQNYARVISGTAEAIPLADASADAAVSALVLCSVPSAARACRELARVVRPGGEVRLLEHVRSPGRLAGALMDAANPLWLAANGQGCRMNRDPLPALAAAGLVVERVEPFQVWSTGLPAFPMKLIVGRRP